MVEVQFNIPSAAEYKDHFLSLRVGDCQRIARLSGSRAFKFPAASVGTRKYGKVEVYRRVGTSTISICPDVASGTNDVGVPLETGAELCMTSSVAATDAKGLQKEKQAEMASSPKGMQDSPSHKAVAQYLNKHHLEVRLADAMQRVLRERPEDPAKMLAELLLTNAGKVAKLPVPADEALETTMKASAPVEQMSKAAPRKPTEAAPATMRPRSGEKKKAASKADTKSFGEYYQKHFTLLNTEGLHKKFKAAPRLDWPVTASEAPAMMLPSMGSYTGACAAFGGMCRFKPSAAVAAKAPVSAPAVKPSAQKLLPSMGSFTGGVGRFGGVLKFNVVMQVTNSTTSADGTHPHLIGKVRQIWEEARSSRPQQAATSADGTHPHLVGKVRQIWEEAQMSNLQGVGSLRLKAAAPVAPPSDRVVLPSMGSYAGPVGLFGGIIKHTVAGDSSAAQQAGGIDDLRQKTKKLFAQRYAETEQASDELRARTQKLFEQKYTDKAEDMDQLRQRARDLLTQTDIVNHPNEDYMLPSMGSSQGPGGPYGGIMLLRGDMSVAGIPSFFFL